MVEAYDLSLVYWRVEYSWMPCVLMTVKEYDCKLSVFWGRVTSFNRSPRRYVGHF